jgi:hypothetical protein
VAEERGKLLEALPEWKDPKMAAKEKAELMQYATVNLGFTEDQVGQISDHRAILALRKAMLYDRGQQRAATRKPVVDKKTVVAKPGPANKRKPMTELTKAKIRLAKTGSKRDAATVFEQFID